LAARYEIRDGRAMLSKLLTRPVATPRIPPTVLCLAALSSYGGWTLALLQGWPLWGMALAMLVPCAPLVAVHAYWTHAHAPWLAFFYLLVIAQLGHCGEHVAQMVQLHILARQGADARGVFGALDIEWVHFAWNTWVI